MWTGYNWPGLETDPFSERLNGAGRLERRRERPSAARETDTDTVAHTEGKERGVSEGSGLGEGWVGGGKDYGGKRAWGGARCGRE